MPRKIPSLCAVLLLGLAQAARAEPGVWLPTTEDPAAWEAPLALAGLEQVDSPGPAMVRILPGHQWTLQVSAEGGDRSIQVVPPTTTAEREALALVAAGLARELAARATPPPPVAPPPPPAVVHAEIVAEPVRPEPAPAVVDAENVVAPLPAAPGNPWAGVLEATPVPEEELVALDTDVPSPADRMFDEALFEDIDLERGQRRDAFGTREPRAVPVTAPPAPRGTGPQLRFASLRLALGTNLMPASSPGFTTRLSSRVWGGERFLVEAGVGVTPGQRLQLPVEPPADFFLRRSRSSVDLLVVAGPRTRRFHAGAVAGTAYHWYTQDQLLATFLVPTFGVQLYGEPDWLEVLGVGLVGRVLTTPVRTTMVLADGSRSQSTPVELQVAATVRFGRWW